MKSAQKKRNLRSSATNYLVVLQVLTLLAPWFSPETVWGQREQQVVRLMDTTEFEGQIGATDELSFAEQVQHPVGSKSIAVVNEGLRRIFFNHRRNVADVSPSSRNDITVEVPQRVIMSGSPGVGVMVHTTPFNQYGHRILVTSDGGQESRVVQGIIALHPRYAEVATISGSDGRPWNMHIPLGLVPVETIRHLLRSRISDPENPNLYTQNVTFFAQAGRFDEAIKEAEFVVSRFPDLANDLNPVIEENRQAFARQIQQEIDLRLSAGQKTIARLWWEVFVPEGIAPRISNDIQQSLAVVAERDERARILAAKVTGEIESLIAAGVDDNEKQTLLEFTSELQENIDEITALRLAPYEIAVGDPQFTLQQRVARAISGWVLGGDRAMDNYAIAKSIMAVRELVRDYLGGAGDVERQAILQKLESMEGADPENLAAIVSRLGPIQPADLTGYTGAEPHSFVVKIPGPKITSGKPLEFRCVAHLPPDYSTSRQYPLLLVLGQRSGDPESMLQFWCGDWNPKLEIRTGQAMRLGFVVVCVDWMLPGQNVCGESAREHATVIAALRESLRKYSIDSDRVTLAGLGQGGTAALDIGVAHPDLFSSIVTISAPAGKYASYYSLREHPALPVYSVMGSRDGSSILPSLKLWNQWLTTKSRYHQLILVQYTGRLNELFPEEQESLLKWALRQRRFWPGRADEFKVKCDVLRPWDGSFWFYSLKGFPPNRLMLPEDWRDTDRPSPLEVSVERDSNRSNRFRLGPTSGAGDSATLWLSPEFVDFGEKIQITGRGDFQDFVVPSRKTILEDVRVRVDQKHPFWVRMVESNKQWKVIE